MISLKFNRIFFFLFSLPLYCVSAQESPDLCSRKLKELYSLLPVTITREIENLDSNSILSQNIDAEAIIHKNSLSVRFNQDRQIEHIGLHLMITSEDDPYLEIHDYVERTLLYFALVKDDNRIKKIIQEEQIHLIYNQQDIRLDKIQKLLSKIRVDNQAPIRVRSNKEFFSATIQLADASILEIEFPNNYGVIKGMLKDEIEKKIMKELQDHVNNGIKIEYSNPEVLKITPNEIFIKKGNILLDHPFINSDTYYLKNQDGTYSPVFTQKYHKESAINVLHNLIRTEQKIFITQKLYGNHEEKYTVNLNGFLNYFNDNYTLYLGWQQDSQNELVASIFVENQVFNFIHLLIVKTTVEQIFNINSTLEGTLYTFIPQNFISI